MAAAVMEGFHRSTAMVLGALTVKTASNCFAEQKTFEVSELCWWMSLGQRTLMSSPWTVERRGSN